MSHSLDIRPDALTDIQFVYLIDGERVTVLAVLHAARHDRQWRCRT